MSSPEFDLLGAFETHSVAEIRALLDAGVSPTKPIKGLTPVVTLLEMYYRSDALPDCLRLLLERGGQLEDPALAPVLLNDPAGVRKAIEANPSLLQHRTTLRSTFTPLDGATLLHVAAEYGYLEVVRVLLEMGAEVDARAAEDEHGLNGHTALFHTVNANANRPEPILRLLLDAGANPQLALKGITWGRGFEWETPCFDVTPVSYAQMGLLPQFQRTEKDIYHNIRLLLAAARRPVPPLENIPNKYLYPKG